MQLKTARRILAAALPGDPLTNTASRALKLLRKYKKQRQWRKRK